MTAIELKTSLLSSIQEITDDGLLELMSHYVKKAILRTKSLYALPFQ